MNVKKITLQNLQNEEKLTIAIASADQIEKF
jgi:hypothetical protein